MALASMTGFARSQGSSGAYAFEWELKSVNAKGFDFRMRLPAGWDSVEAAARKRAGEQLARGTVYANLTVKRADTAVSIRINNDVLDAVLNVAADLSARIAAKPPTVDGLLAIKGILDVSEPEDRADDRKSAEGAVLGAFDMAMADLVAMRRREGVSLQAVLAQRLDELAGLAARAEAAPGRKPEAIKARIAEQIALLVDGSERLDPERLHQEALLIAARADIREELDRIASHVAQAREMLGASGAVGRRLDFLAQEFNREVNTTCSKSNDIELTAIGMEMKNVVEQFREQVQNLE